MKIVKFESILKTIKSLFNINLRTINNKNNIQFIVPTLARRAVIIDKNSLSKQIKITHNRIKKALENSQKK